MRKTIGFVNVTTSRTGAARISGVNQENWHANPFGFVGHEGAKLEERPTMQGCPLCATNRNPLADTAQIFQGNRSICVFRFGNQFLADAVVGVFGKTVFFSRKPFEFTFGGARPFGLQFSPQAAVTVANIIDLTGFVDFTIVIYSNIYHSEVNPQRAFNIKWLWFGYLASSRKEKHPFVQPKVAFSLPCLKQFQLTFTAYKRYTKSPIHRPNRHSSILQPPGQDAVIIGDTSSCIERAFRFAVKFVRIGNFGNCSYCNLRRKPELLSHRLITLVMQVILSKGFRFPSRITHKPTGGIGLFQRVPERAGLFGCWEKLDLGIQFHAIDYRTNVLNLQCLKLFLLAFLDIAFDGFRANVTRRTNIVPFGPQRCIFAPILAPEAFKLFLQPAGSNPFEQTDDFSGSKFRRCAYKQMHMVGHTCTPPKAHFVCGKCRCNLNCQYFKPVLCGDFRQEFFQPCLNRPNQNLISIARYPN